MDDTQAAELGAHIRKNREAVGLSIRRLASLVGIDQAQIIRLEQGKVASPKADVLDRIAGEIRVPVADLLTMAGYPVTRSLPSLRPYMRAKYRDLPPEAINEVEDFVKRLQAEHGSGPNAGEDEA